MIIAATAGRLIRHATAPGFRRHLRSLDDPANAQQRLLRQIIGDSARSAYGRHHGLSASDDLNTFRDSVPIAAYEDLRPWVNRAIFEKEPGVLSPHPVVRVEATSGSSAGVKWIPYTRPMMRTFSRMFSLWSHDLLQHLYRPQSGKLFMCVTGGRPDDKNLARQQVGDDRDYLGKRWRVVLERFVIAPQFAKADDPLERLAMSLDREPKLEVMSFWSPSLLLSVLNHMGITTPEETMRRWPNLQLISCWKAASSARFADRVRELFPEVSIQGKGLLATEAALTIPLEGRQGCAPLLDDVFLEFVAKDGSIRGLEALEDGSEYEVLISNRAGFLRYRLGDRVRVCGFFRNTPLLEFIGRAGVVSDLVGEKLTAEFVEYELSRAIDHYYCLLPLDRGYQLWIDSSNPNGSADELDRCLSRNFHYARARKLEQLQPLQVRHIDRLDDRIRACTEQQQSGRARAFKPPLMISDRPTARHVSRELQRTLRDHRD